MSGELFSVMISFLFIVFMLGFDFLYVKKIRVGLL